MHLIFLGILAAQQITAQCVAFNSSLCSPYSSERGSSVSVDLRALSRHYKTRFKTLDDYTLFISSAVKPAHCGTEALQYERSIGCMRDIFVTSKNCNKDVRSLVSYCPEVCENFNQALTASLLNCPNSKGVKASKNRKKAAAGLKKCTKLRTSKYFDLGVQCVSGVVSDQQSCGFGGNSTIAAEYCLGNPKSNCCSSLKSQAKSVEGWSTSIQRISMVLGLISSASTVDVGAEPQFTSTPSFYVLIGAIVVVLLLATLFIVYRTRKVVSEDVKESAPLVKEIERTESSAGMVKCIVKYVYVPNLSDEISLHVGDIIIFESLSDDGWGDATNETSGEKGKACTRFCERIT